MSLSPGRAQLWGKEAQTLKIELVNMRRRADGSGALVDEWCVDVDEYLMSCDHNGDGPDNTYWMSQAQITHRYPSAPFDALMKEFATNERKDWGPRVESDAGDAAHELLRLENAMPFEYVKSSWASKAKKFKDPWPSGCPARARRRAAGRPQARSARGAAGRAAALRAARATKHKAAARRRAASADWEERLLRERHPADTDAGGGRRRSSAPRERRAQPAAGGGAAAERDAAVKVLVAEFVAAIVWERGSPRRRPGARREGGAATRGGAGPRGGGARVCRARTDLLIVVVVEAELPGLGARPRR